MYIYIVYYCILVVFCIVGLKVLHGLINLNQSINQSINSFSLSLSLSFYFSSNVFLKYHCETQNHRTIFFKSSRIPSAAAVKVERGSKTLFFADCWDNSYSWRTIAITVLAWSCPTFIPGNIEIIYITVCNKKFFFFFQFPTLKMSLIVYSNKHRGRRAMIQNPKRCLNRLSDYISDEASFWLVCSKSFFARSNFRGKSTVLHGDRKSRKIRISYKNKDFKKK